jgi:sensor c-di-GMP phosphodiesterase-like protein
MIFLPKVRTWVSAITILLAAAAGAAAGFLVGRIHTLHMAEARLAKNADKLESMLDSFLRESDSLLVTINASNYPYCSDSEIAWLRQLIYHSTYLRDAGRMRDGRIECSADFGKTGLPHTSYVPIGSPWGGFNVYSNPPLYASGKWPVYLIQKKSSYVVEDPGFEKYWHAVYTSYEIFMPGSPARRWASPEGKPSHFQTAVVNRDWQGIEGDSVYATRCSPETRSCTLAYGSYSAELYSDRIQLVLSASLGSLTSVLLVLAYLLIYQHCHSMCQQLHRAIRKDKLRVYYQPIVDLTTQRIIEAEALVRWTDDHGFAVRPDLFVHIAEERGFVGELTELVIRHVLRDFSDLLRGNPAFRVNINITASDLVDPAFLPRLDRSLRKAGVAARSLGIEVTESSTARKLAAIQTIHQLRSRGHSVLIDDFGTGYSSLAYLKDLAVDAIKIDKAFTQTIGTEAVIGNILPQILAMADSLDLMVVVEGIETPEQAQYFAGSAKPMMGQGWLFGHPVPADELKENLASQVKKVAN